VSTVLRSVGDWGVQAWRRLPEAARFVTPIFVAERVGLSLYAVLCLHVFPPGSVPAEYLHGLDMVNNGLRGWLLGPWLRWDAFWYVRIASMGYNAFDGSTAFFPLYPLAIRLLAPLVGSDYLLAALLVSNTACFAAMILLYQLACFELGRECARRTVLYQLVFPVAFFLFCPYTESLFLLWAIACFYAARRERWWLAGGFGLLAALTRNTGVFLVLPLAYEMWFRSRSTKRMPGSETLAIALVPIGVALFSLYLAMHLGQPLLWLTRQELWERSLTWPWETAHQILLHLSRPLHNTVDLLFTLVFAALTLLAFRRLSPSYGLYMLGSILPPLLSPRTGTPLYSMPRFVLVLFPGFMILALIGRRAIWNRLIVYGSQVFLTLFTALYIAWYWVA
jgi:hypothetical protein